jgi:hypothetical protein
VRSFSVLPWLTLHAASQTDVRTETAVPGLLTLSAVSAATAVQLHAHTATAAAAAMHAINSATAAVSGATAAAAALLQHGGQCTGTVPALYYC